MLSTPDIPRSGGSQSCRPSDPRRSSPTRQHVRSCGLAHGERLRLGGRDFHIITGGGHAFDQAMLYSPADRLFFSADQILARISPNVAVWPIEPEADSLGAYLRSLESLKKTLPEDLLILPGHHSPFYGVRTRIEQLQQHHRDRCAEIAESCQIAPKTIAELTSIVFRQPLDGHQMSFAYGEVVAHLNHLVRNGILENKHGRFQTTELISKVCYFADSTLFQ